MGDAAVPTLLLDARDGDWRARRATMLSFLDIQGTVDLPKTPDTAVRLVGSYRHGASTFTVALNGSDLVVNGLLWPENRLLAVEPDVFEAESWPVVLRFLEMEGEIRAVRVEAPVVAGRRLDAVYERVGYLPSSAASGA